MCSDQCSPQFKSSTEIYATGKEHQQQAPGLLGVYVKKRQHLRKDEGGAGLIT